MIARDARKDRWLARIGLHGLRRLGYNGFHAALHHYSCDALYFCLTGFVCLAGFFCLTGGQFVQSEQNFGRPVGVFWHDIVLRSALDDLAANQRVTIWLDRRVDPNQTVDFSGGNQPLLELLDDWAKTQGMSAGHVGPAVYIGPRKTVQKLATLERLRQRDVSALPESVRLAWQQPRTITWETLDSPRDILNQLAKELGCTPPTGETIPHDLWRKSQLSNVDAAQALTLLLANFDLTFRIDRSGRRIRWEPIPAEVRWQASYPPNDGQSIDWKKLETIFPNLRWTQNSRGITLDGPVEAHEALERMLSPPRGVVGQLSPTKTEQRFTLNVKQLPLEEVLQAIGKQAHLELHWETNGPRRQPVTFSVQRVKLEELIQAAIDGTNFRWKVADQQLQILDK